jgi:hypothetical protein
LFSELSKDIENVLDTNKEKIPDSKLVARTYQNRLQSLAKRVASSQLSSIFSSSKSFSFEVPFDDIEKNYEGTADVDFDFNWPRNKFYEEGTDSNVVELEGIKRQFYISFKNADYAKQSVQIKLEIFEIVKVESPAAQDAASNWLHYFRPQATESYEESKKTTDLEFTLNFFNFPLIDNTRLSSNQRFSLILENYDSNTLKVVGIVFPGLYASQRDKPFLNEAIRELGDQRVPFDETAQ